jgi:hypothetical protein
VPTPGQVDSTRVWLRGFALFCVYYVVAAAAHAGVFAKWTFRDDSHRLSLIMSMDGTADRPFVYRRLLPEIANKLDAIVPERFKTALNPGKHLSRIFARATDSENPRYEFRYDVVYTLEFLSLLLAMFVLRAICQCTIGDGIAATVAPAIFALFLPLILTIGGYYYDLTELLFLSLAVWVCLRRWAWILPVLTILATFNKESFLFFIPALYPLVRIRYSKMRAAILIAGCIAIAVAINLAMREFYRSGPGVPVELHLLENLRFYVHPQSYFNFEFSYGILTPKGLSLITIALVTVTFALGWPTLPRILRQHFFVAALIDIPLTLVLGFGGELRNFSFLYVALVCMICGAINASGAVREVRNPDRAPTRTMK